MLFPHWKPPVAPELLESTNFFLLYPFDGGGNFIQQDILGTLDDLESAENILHRGALAEFGEFPELDFRKFERWSTIEKDSWINRLYFTASLGHAYALTGERSIAEGLKQLLLGFARRYPAPQGEEAVALDRRVLYARDHDYNAKGPEFDDDTEYIWFDFQPASRVINILNACWFIREAGVFSRQEEDELRAMLLGHVRNIYVKEREFYPLNGDNHQSVRALALLYGCAFFQNELPDEAAQWLQTAIPLSQYHLQYDRLPDGMGNDLSPSYHFFVTWITRDTLLLAERLGIHFEETAIEQARKSFDVCHLLRQPDGLSTVISDGYPLRLDAFLQTLPPPRLQARKTTVLPVAKLGIQKEHEAFLLFDCSPLLASLSHFHGGKQGVTLFLAGTPILADSGCCNYDDPRFAPHYKQSFAHSSLLLDGQGDSLIEGRYKWLAAPTCQLEQDGDNLVSTMTSPVSGWEGVSWTRRVQLQSATEAVIEDEVQNPAGRAAEFPLILHPEMTIVECSGAEAVLESGNARRFAVRSCLPLEAGEGLGYLPFRCVPCRKLTVKGGSKTAIKNTIRIFLI